MERIKNILCGKDKNKYHFHFVGIGGVSMYSLAIYLKNLNQEIRGSDVRQSQNTKNLQKKGINISFGHKQENVFGADFVVYSFAVENNVEVKAAKALKIPCLSRAELLGLILKTYKKIICVSGAHGKTTTTALIYEILKKAGKKPSLHLGGSLCSIGESYDHNLKDFIVCEACEYKDAFLNFEPSVAVVLNIAKEHLDYFKTFENVKKSFNTFSKNAKVLICEDLHKLENKNKIILGEGGFTAKNIKKCGKGLQQFDVYKHNEFYGTFILNLIGGHNIFNAIASIAVADYYGVSKKHIYAALKEFKGVKRRFEVISKKPLVISDYAHHPDEIFSAINSVKSFYGKRVFVVFQPHTYSRTKNLMHQFKTAFSGCNVLIYRTYSARETYTPKGSAKTLANNICAEYANNLNILKHIVRQKVKEKYIILFLGAGNLSDKIKNVVDL